MKKISNKKVGIDLEHVLPLVMFLTLLALACCDLSSEFGFCLAMFWVPFIVNSTSLMLHSLFLMLWSIFCTR
jgi:hypothetical protein